jgi:DNA-binding SARP family transcriptional activator/class 3 adenylate cyclase
VLDDDGLPLALGGAKQRALLAVLLLHAGHVVAADRLIDELWGEEPPETARSVLQVYVANLRKVLEPARSKRTASTLLKTQPPGYRLDLGGHTLDLDRFERLMGEGRAGLAAGQASEAATLLREALGLWRGPALGDVALLGRGQGAVADLEERRLAALEDRIEAELALGRHRELIGELETLVAEYPLRERLHGQLALALYRSGRQGEALDAYRRTRKTLAEELGIDPSRPLQELERAILAQDPGLDWAPHFEHAHNPTSPAGDSNPPVDPAQAPIPAVSLSAAMRAPVEERKVVTLLSCGLVGLVTRTGRADPEDVQARLRPYRARLRAELERFGGSVEGVVGDGVMAVFGAPIAHEDDPERAVRAGLRLLEAVEELNQADPSFDLSLRVGVCTGEALVTIDAQPEPGEGIVTGEVVNSVLGLHTAAIGGQVVVDETTRRATQRAIIYREAVPAKRGAQPVAAWEAVSPRASPGAGVAQAPGTPLIARDRELDLLQGALARARGEQTPQLVTLVGMPGIGKSRLVFELGQHLEADSELTTWRQGRCLPYGDGVALWALGEIVKTQAGILDSDPAEEAAGKLDRAVGDLLPDEKETGWVTGHLGPLVGLTGTTELGGDRQAEAFAAWRRFLEALAEQRPAVLVIEDLHWADDALLDFLDHLVDWAADVPLVVVATARPELLTRRPGWGGGKPNSTTVSLAPLSDEDTARLVAGLLEQALLPADLQAALLARAGGNPLYAEEYVRMLADRGYLRRTQTGTWRLDRAEELPLPETVQAIIAARLDALAPSEKALLQDAAVLGETGWLGALVALAGEAPWALEQRLHTLERKEFVRRERHSQVAGERQYAFRHVLVRDVCYSQLPRAARAAKHHRAAQWLEELSPDRAEDRAELLAHHWQAAVEFARAAGQGTAALVERARVVFRDAGDRAHGLNAFATAARWYEAALDLWPTHDPERPRLLLRLGEARVFGEQAGGELLTEARDGLLAVGDREAAADAEVLLSQLAWWQGDNTRLADHIRQAMALVTDASPSRSKANVLTHLAGSLLVAGRSTQAIRAGREAITIAESLGLDDLRADALNYVGSARVLGGDRGGLADLEQALQVAVELNSPRSVLAYLNLATALIELGELARGFELQAEGRRAAERLGITGWLRHFHAERVMEDYWCGRWDTAIGHADEFIAESEAGSQHYIETMCRLVRGHIRLARDDVPAALEDAETLLEFARMATDPQQLNPALAFRARAALAVGDLGRAGAHASELLAVLAEQEERLAGPEWLIELAIVLEALGRGNELRELTADGREPTPWLEAATALSTGEFERAADICAEIGSRPDEAFARLRAAGRLLAAGQRAEGTTQLERALSFYQQVAASAYLHEAEALLSASA